MSPHIPRISFFPVFFLLLAPLPPAPDCGALNAALRARFDQVLERGRAEDRDYDQRTGHGKTQGATLR